MTHGGAGEHSRADCCRGKPPGREPRNRRLRKFHPPVLAFSSEKRYPDCSQNTEVGQVTLGEKLQMLRSHAGMSQEELAERLNVSRQAISKWELNKTVPEVKYIVSISGIFGVTTDILLKEGTDAAESAGNSKGQTASPDSHREQPEILTDRAAGLPDTGAGKCSGGYAAGDVVALRLSRTRYTAADSVDSRTFHIGIFGKIAAGWERNFSTSPA